MPSDTCVFLIWSLAVIREGILFWSALALWLLARSGHVLVKRWFKPHFALKASLGLDAWVADVQHARSVAPLWPACWEAVACKSRTSTSWEVHEIWEVHFDLFRSVPGAVRDALHHHHCNVCVDLDSAWKV